MSNAQALGVGNLGASPFASAWSTQAGGAAHMRLIAAGLVKGTYRAAVEIKLAPRAVTYWRTPGEAGVPPRFSFAGSKNVASARVLYPAPQRLNEDGIEAYGYRGGVVFPILVRPVDITKPSRLDLTLNYAVCDRICIPAKGRVNLLLPRTGASPLQALIAAAEARVPVALKAGDVAHRVDIRAAPHKGKPHWSLVWKGAMTPTDLFVEGPQDWAFETHKTGAKGFGIAAVATPSPIKMQHVRARFTLTGRHKSYEFTAALAVTAGRP